jgi:hypothetical protein
MRERLSQKLGPIYLRDGEAFADGIDPERVVFIRRQYVDPPEREQDALPESSSQPSG